MSELESKDFYERLGIDRDASIEQIREAYRDIARIYHPDSHFYDDLLSVELKQLSPAQEATFRLVTEAYNTLINQQLREAYNKRIKPPPAAEWTKPEPGQTLQRKDPEKSPRQRKVTTEMKISIVNNDRDEPTVAVKIQSVNDLINSQRQSAIRERPPLPVGPRALLLAVTVLALGCALLIILLR